jgi:hypothetical protein
MSAWNARPFAPPTVMFLRGPPADEATRTLADALVRTYSGARLSLTWVLAITIAPGFGSSFTLPFAERFPEGEPFDLGTFEYSWREPAVSVPTADLSGYAALVYEQIEETRLGIWTESYEAWAALQTPAPLAPSRS